MNTIKLRRLLALAATTAVMLNAKAVFGNTAYDNAILADNPVGYWPMQETSGTTIADITGNGNNGTMFVSTDAPGGQQEHITFAVSNSGFTMGDVGLLPAFPGDTSIYFNTVNTNGAEIAVPYTNTMDTQTFTGEAWLRIPTFPVGYVGVLAGQSNNMPDQAVMGPSSGGGDSHQTGWLIDLQSDHIANSTNANPAAGRVDAWVGKNSGWTAITSGPTNNGQIVYVVETYDGTNLSLYENGVLKVKTPSTHTTQAAGGHTLFAFVMGSYQQDYFTASTPALAGGERTRFYVGGMSHVAVYSNALSASQIANHWFVATNGNLPQPPSIVTQPVGGTNYIGYSRTLTVAATGTPPLYYQWIKDTVPLGGQTNISLVLTNLALTNAGNYSVTVTNHYGSTNSEIVSVGVLSLPSDPYQSNIISQFPRAFYPLHETNGTVAADLIDPVDNDGTYVTQDTNVPPLLPELGEPGPSSFLGTSVTLDDTVTNGIVINNPSAMGIIGNLTLEAWVQVQDVNDEQWIVAHSPAIDANPSKTSDRLEINSGYYIVERYQQTAIPTDFGAYYAIPSQDQGSWVYLVGVADGTAWRLYENGVEVANVPDTNSPAGAIFANGGWSIGGRNANSNPQNIIAPSLTGSINNVAIYDYALSPETILQHYQIGLTGIFTPPPTMSIESSGANVIVSWTSGFLQKAASITGPWTYADTNTAVSPYTVGATNAAAFFRATLTPPP